VNGMIRYNSSSTGSIEAYYNSAWNTLGGSSGSTINLGTSASATNPQRSSQAGTGLFSATTNVVSIADNSADVMDVAATGPNILGTITSGSYSIGYQINGNNAVWQDASNQNLAVGTTNLPAAVSQSGGGSNGKYNVAVGANALYANTTGFYNTALGEDALIANTTGNTNTAVGSTALFRNTVGSSNMALGYEALYSNTTANANTAVGFAALYTNTTGSSNTALGSHALSNASTGQYNTAVGSYALGTTTTGTNNTAIGYLVGNTTLTTGSYNLLIGTSAAVDTPAAGTNYNLNIGNLLQGDMTNVSATAGSGNLETLYLQSTASGVDYFQMAGGAAGTPGVVTLSAQGSDSNVSIAIMPKGTGNVGIGTAAPVLLTHLASSNVSLPASSGAQTNGILRIGSTSGYLALDVGLWGTAPYGAWLQVTSTQSSSPYSLLLNPNGGNVGIGTTSPNSSLDISQHTDAVSLPSGTISQRPTPVNGMIRYNSSSTGSIEAYYNSAWNTLGGSSGGSTINLGTAAAATNPQRSSQAGTGLFSATTNVVSIADNSADVMDVAATGPNILGTITSGSYSIGYQINGNNAVWQDTTNFNLAVGSTALPTTVSQTGGGNNGKYNMVIGQAALGANTTGYYNIAAGYAALNNNTTGTNNTAFGPRALQDNTTGISNTAVGYAALQNNSTGVSNTAVGSEALNANTTGTYNTAFGYNALAVNTINGGNTALGGSTLSGNTTGANNTAVGYETLAANSTGSNNAALGVYALYRNTTGGNNTALGYQALYINTTGQNNTAIGYAVGSTTLATGSNNILIGTSNAVDAPTAGTSFNLNIGNLLQGDMTNSTATYNKTLYLQSTSNAVDYLQIAGGASGSPGTVAVSGQGSDSNINIELLPKGTGGVTVNTTTSQGSGLTINGDAWATVFTTTSDERLKKNIQTLDDALERVGKLRGVSFEWRAPEEREIGQDMTLPTDEAQIGVIAQEVEQVFPEAVSTGTTGVKSVNYSGLIGPLIEAVKEQQREIKAQQREIDELKDALSAFSAAYIRDGNAVTSSPSPNGE
jgi:trimeric autotransporter adhesin